MKEQVLCIAAAMLTGRLTSHGSITIWNQLNLFKSKAHSEFILAQLQDKILKGQKIFLSFDVAIKVILGMS